jgi:CubicO group peptidase (beta-lactamase class C family)
MPLQRKRVLGLLAAGLFIIIAALALTLYLNREPEKPQPIPIGDYTYAGELAKFRIDRLMKQHHIPGASAALIVGQEIVWQESFGLADLEQEIPVTEDTVFKLWSLAKPFTAVETMRLVEEGLIDLDAPLTTYVPDFTIQSRFPEGETITIRHILAHHSGLPRNACTRPDWYFGADALE